MRTATLEGALRVSCFWLGISIEAEALRLAQAVGENKERRLQLDTEKEYNLFIIIYFLLFYLLFL